jgi:hypothetical protein
MDLHLIELDRHDVRVHLTAVVPLHFGAIRGSTAKPDRRRGGPRRRVGLVVCRVVFAEAASGPWKTGPKPMAYSRKGFLDVP